jgi:diguanylate cyclase (GGDEF)-like protein
MTLVALVLGTITTSSLLVATERTRSQVQHLSDAIGHPKDHLLAAQRSNDSGQAALAAAVGANGPDRAALLSEAIDHSQDVSSEWARYRQTAAGLPGEAALVRAFERHQAIASATSKAVLVPILTSTEPAVLPEREIEAYNAVRDDLVALHSLYRQEDRARLAELESHTARFVLLIALGAALALVVLVAAAVVGMRSARRLMRDRAERAASAHLTTFEGRLRRALEWAEDDAAAFLVADRAVREMVTGTHFSVLVADASRARLTAVHDEPVCRVASPGACPALRAASALRFPDSRALDACPVLAANSETACSTTCVPVTITGRGAAVLQLVGEPGHPPDELGAVDLVARGVGDRLTLLQALATFQLQAERDPLTGLLNRRSLETSVAQVLATGTRYAVAFGDLDHFKQLNDLHGHEAGDRALRAFARTLRESLRPQDITCRWGGEEFVVVLPDCDEALAVEAMDRVRTNLALGAMAGQTAAVTVSFGVAEALEAESFDEVVERADGALHHAKAGGRNRVVGYEAAFQPSPPRADVGAQPSGSQ